MNKININIKGHGFIVLPHKALKHNIWEMINANIWEPNTFDIISERSGNIFWDIGAWIGMITLFASKKFNMVISFEPDKESFIQLNKNLSENKIENVITVNKAVYKETGEVNFGFCRDTGFNASESSINYTSKDNYIVNTISIPDAIKMFGQPDFVKIDIEGGEEYLIKDILSSNIKVFFMSVHPIKIKNKKEFNTNFNMLNTKYFIVYNKGNDYLFVKK